MLAPVATVTKTGGGSEPTVPRSNRTDQGGKKRAPEAGGGRLSVEVI